MNDADAAGVREADTAGVDVAVRVASADRDVVIDGVGSVEVDEEPAGVRDADVDVDEVGSVDVDPDGAYVYVTLPEADGTAELEAVADGGNVGDDDSVA